MENIPLIGRRIEAYSRALVCQLNKQNQEKDREPP